MTKKRLSILAIIIVILFFFSLLLNSVDIANDSTGTFTVESSALSQVSRSFDDLGSYGDFESDDMYYDEDAYDIAEEEQYVIKTGDVELIVEDINTAADQLSAIATQYNGTVTNRYIYSRGDYTYGDIELKVEESQFDSAMNSIKDIAQSVTSENVNADDVTEQVIDIQARLSNSQAEEVAYVSVLNQATTVEDILNVQYYLSNVREEIERYEAQLEHYQGATSYSTISIYLEQATSITLGSDEFRPLQTIKDSAQTVIRLFQGLVLGVIELAIVGGAAIIPILILFFGGRWIYRKYRK
ncbi:DUF4349 domain-containing protein [Candidatus Uhrbacteria bacterium]|jgi:hypothetical protein|nr:DUF4349 domain-containing protein [Candidatus Uhrbacteria bacterium]MBT7716822.1 DUF4349 domain-containing protein [Candidatus Uhrbacteria bacterium]